MTDDAEIVQLDLDQFTSPEQALSLIQREHGFDNDVKPILSEAVSAMAGPTMLLSFCQSAITRANGLYAAIAREIGAADHPAVFVLMRQFAETVAVVRYTADHPDYVAALIRPERERKPGEPKRMSPQALVNYMDKHYSTQFKPVYEELSELCHFGSKAVWASHVMASADEHRVIWRSQPAWRSRRTMYVACAQLLELGNAMADALMALCTSVKERAVRRDVSGEFYEVSEEDAEAVRNISFDEE